MLALAATNLTASTQRIKSAGERQGSGRDISEWKQKRKYKCFVSTLYTTCDLQFIVCE